MPVSQPLPLLDHAHLDAQTFGDAALACELLDLFAKQCGRLLPGILDTARPATERADFAHTLKGSSLGVGASRVAALSAEVEEALRTTGELATALPGALADAVAATLAEIAPPR